MPAMPTMPSSSTMPSTARGTTTETGAESFSSVLEAHASTGARAGDATAKVATTDARGEKVSGKSDKDATAKKHSDGDRADAGSGARVSAPLAPAMVAPVSAPALLVGGAYGADAREDGDAAADGVEMAAVTAAGVVGGMAGAGLAGLVGDAAGSGATGDGAPAQGDGKESAAAGAGHVAEAVSATAAATTIERSGMGAGLPRLASAGTKNGPAAVSGMVAGTKPGIAGAEKVAVGAAAAERLAAIGGGSATQAMPLVTTQATAQHVAASAQAAVGPQAQTGMHNGLSAASGSGRAVGGATRESAPHNGGTSDGGTTRDGAQTSGGQTAGGTDAGRQAAAVDAPGMTAMLAAAVPAGMQGTAMNTPGAAAGSNVAKETGAMAAEAGDAATGVAGTDASATMGRVQVAKLLHTAAGSELRVGVQTEEFGAISIRTAMGREQLSAHISVDGDRPGSAALSSHLSSLGQSLSERLGESLGVKASVSVGAETTSNGGRESAQRESAAAAANGGGAGTGAGSGSASGSARQQQQSGSMYAVPAPVRGGEVAGMAGMFAQSSAPAVSGRLDIRI